MQRKLVNKLLSKVKRDYAVISDEFDNTRQGWWPEQKLLASYITQGDRVVDWGCGNGRFFELVRHKDVHYLGIDNCKELLQKAQANYPANMYPHVEWILGTDIPYKSYDIIVAFAAWHHLPSKELRFEMLKQFHERLKPGGRLLLTTWNLKQKKYFWLWLKNNLRNLFGSYDWNDIFVPWKHDQQTVYRYYHHVPRRELKHMALQVGFEIEKCSYSYKGKQVSWWKGRNLVLIAKKA